MTYEELMKALNLQKPVQLNSGGPDMYVQNLSRWDEKAFCTWMVEGEKAEQWFGWVMLREPSG